MTQESSFFMSVGKQIKGEYGRTIGRITSLSVKPNGRVDCVYVELANGEIIKHSVEDLQFEGSEVHLQSKMKMKATSFCDQIPLIWRKNQALRELVGKDKISPEIYEDLHGSFEGVLNQLKSEAKELVESIDKKIGKRSEQIKELNYALVSLEIEHEIGKIDDQSYDTALIAIQDCLKRINTEKSDLEAMNSKLSNVLLGETSPQIDEEVAEKPPLEVPADQESPTPPSPASNLPEPPVVVYVKELGKSST